MAENAPGNRSRTATQRGVAILSVLAVTAVFADFAVLVFALAMLPSPFTFDHALWRPWLLNVGTVTAALAFAIAGSSRQWPLWATVLIKALTVFYSYFFITQVFASVAEHFE